MICYECSREADAVKNGETDHKHYESVYDAWRTWGASKSPLGHGACQGCDCQHKPVGTHEGKPRE